MARNMNENSLKNLKPHKLTPEESKNGAYATHQARREKKDLCTAINTWLNSPIGKDKDGNELTGTDYMIQVAIKEMMKGNPKFWELLRDTSGQKPIDKIAVAEIDQTTIDEIENIIKNVDG